jgi:predicted ribosome quality control (RQC) complex YloA/Tae2 family protein
MYDGLTLGAYLEAWRPFLSGARLLDVVQLDAVDRRTNKALEDGLRDGEALVIGLANGREERELVFAVPGRYAGLFLWQDVRLRRSKPQSRRRTGELAHLKRLLGGDRISAVRQHGRDRLVDFELEGSDELGEPRRTTATFMLTGRRANLVLRRDGAVFRSWRPGVRYGEPFKAPPGGVDNLGEFLRRRRSGEFAPRRKRSLAGELVARVDGFSFRAVEELFRRLGLSGDVAFGELDDEALDRLAAAGDALLAERGVVRFYPEPGVLSCLPLTGLGAGRPATREDEAAVVAEHERRVRRGRLTAALGDVLERLAGRKRKLRADAVAAVDKAENADELQTAGQLLLARPNVKAPAPAEFELPDGGVVELDPDKSWLANAQELFERAKRYRRARDYAAKLERRAAKLERDYAEAAAALEPDAPLDRAAEVYRRWCDGGEGDDRDRGDLPAKVGHRRLPGGFELYWGRDGKSNEFVTFKLARPGDVWFHVQQGPGAHVIVKRPHREAQLPPAVIERAARTALRHSKMRTSSHVPIVYTERRYVRHRRGAPGAVFYEREKVISLDGDF